MPIADMNKECPFCPGILDPSQIVLENELCLFLQREQPVLRGSGIIIPKEHRTTLFDLTKEEWSASLSLLHEAKDRLDRELHPDGYNVGWNVGKVAGQEVFHVHMHVMPRFADEPYAGRGIRYWLKREENRRPNKPGD